MLKKIYQELMAIRKELQAIRSSVEFCEKSSRIMQSTSTEKKVEIKGIIIDLPTYGIQQVTKESK